MDPALQFGNLEDVFEAADEIAVDGHDDHPPWQAPAGENAAPLPQTRPDLSHPEAVPQVKPQVKPQEPQVKPVDTYQAMVEDYKRGKQQNALIMQNLTRAEKNASIEARRDNLIEEHLQQNIENREHPIATLNQDEDTIKSR